MEIEKVLTVAAPAARVWDMLLDPTVMASCVPGMKSIEVISDVEYNAVIHVKISFISAKFKLKTRIVEQRAPEYLRAEGTGEDTSVASSLKQQSEIFLTALPDGRTELRTRVKIDVLGRLGTFGLSVMKTKADRMWEEFSRNLATRLAGGEVPGAAQVTVTRKDAAAPAPAAAAPAIAAASPAVPASRMAPPAPAVPPAARVNGVEASRAAVADGGWWSRLLGGRSGAAGRDIRIELRRGDTALTVDWPAERAGDCAAWLKDVLK